MTFEYNHLTAQTSGRSIELYYYLHLPQELRIGGLAGPFLVNQKPLFVDIEVFTMVVGLMRSRFDRG